MKRSRHPIPPDFILRPQTVLERSLFPPASLRRAAGLTLQMFLHPAERFGPHLRGVDVAQPGKDQALKAFVAAVESVNWSNGGFDGMDPVDRRAAVLVAGHEEHGSRRD